MQSTETSLVYENGVYIYLLLRKKEKAKYIVVAL
jgi:hypothetical protein